MPLRRAPTQSIIRIRKSVITAVYETWLSLEVRCLVLGYVRLHTREMASTLRVTSTENLLRV